MSKVSLEIRSCTDYVQQSVMTYIVSVTQAAEDANRVPE